MISTLSSRGGVRCAAALALLLGSVSTVDAVADTLQIEDAWVRAMPPTQTTTAAYLTCRNTSDAALTLTGASAGGAGAVSLHETRRRNGQMSMRPVEALTLDPGETVRFEPGGLHLMLTDMPRMPPSGETMELCLLSDRGRHCVRAPVRRDAEAADPAHEHHSSSAGSLL